MTKVFNYIREKVNVNVLLFLCSLIIIFPFLMAVVYAVPSADDFCYIMFSKVRGGQFFLSGLNSAVQEYLNWQGTYSGNFFCGFFSFFFVYGGIRGLQLGLLFFVIFFFVALFLLCYAVAVFFPDGRLKNCLYIYLICIIQILFYTKINETFYWYCGANIYLVPICFFMLSIAFCIMNIFVGKRLYICLAALLGFIASGGALNVAALNCAVMLGILLLAFFYKNSRSVKGCLWIFVFSLVGAAFNAFAPGNFVRNHHFNTGSPLSGVSILNAARYTVTVFNEIMRENINNGFFYLFAVVLLLMFYDSLRKMEFNFDKPFLVSVYSICANLIVIFPVALGYNSWTYPVRVKFVYQLSYTIFTSFTMLYWFGWMIKRGKIKISLHNKFLLFVSVFFIVAVDLYADSSKVVFCMPIRIVKNLLDSDYSGYYKYNVDMLSQIEKSLDDDVVLHVKRLDNKDTYMDIFSEKNEWSYPTIANFYGKKSLTVIMEED